MIVQRQRKTEAEKVEYRMVAIVLLVRYANLSRAGEALEHRCRLVELLTVRILVVLILNSSLPFQIGEGINLQSCQFEILLFLNHRINRLIDLQESLRKCIVALPDYPPAPLVVSVDVQVFTCDHVHEVLQHVIVHAYGRRIETLNAQDIALVAFRDAQQVYCVLFFVDACVS